jgi:hypothetical protein
MPLPISSELKGRILALGAQKWSSFMIVKELKKQNLDVSRATVQNVLKNNQFTAENQEANGPPAKKKRQPHIWTPTVIKKLKNYIASDNPLTQKEMGRRVGVPQQSVSYLIRNDLDYRKKKKVKVHHLTENTIAQRKIIRMDSGNFFISRITPKTEGKKSQLQASHQAGQSSGCMLLALDGEVKPVCILLKPKLRSMLSTLSSTFFPQ